MRRTQFGFRRLALFAAIGGLGTTLAYLMFRRRSDARAGESPGHRRSPEHTVTEYRISERVQFDAAGAVVADSTDVIRVDEDGQPSRFYFPRSHVRTDWLAPSRSTAYCPFKGTARYYHLSLNGVQLRNAAWSYEYPFDEHRALKDRLAFDEDRIQAAFVSA